MGAGRDGLGVLGSLVLLPLGQRGLEHRDGVGGLPGGLIGGGEPVPGHHGVGVIRAEQPGTGGHHGLPVRDGRVGQPALLQREPGAEQQRVSLRLPQQRAVAGPQRRRAVPQRLLELASSWVAAADGCPAAPSGQVCKQRVRGGQHGLLHVGGRQVGPDRGLHAGVHLHGAHGAARVDGDQARLRQVVDGRAHRDLVGRVRDARPACDVAAGGRAGQHGTRHAVLVEHRGQHQRRPGQPGRRQLVRALRGQRPGGQDGGGDAGDRGHVPPSLGQQRAVLPAALTAHLHHRGGLGQPERQPFQVLAQVQRLDPLVGVVRQPGGEVVEGLAAVQPADTDDPHAGEARSVEGRARQPGGDQDPAGRPGRPQPVQVAQLGQVVEDQRPRLPGPLQPGHEPGRGRFRALVERAGVGHVRRLREAGHDRVPAGGVHPDQDLGRAGIPHRVGELDRQLRLARAALGGRRHLGLAAVDQHRGLPEAQDAAQARSGQLAREIGVGERRHGPGQQYAGTRA